MKLDINHPLGIRDTQLISLEILKFITNICEVQKFRYCLMYGTLIGAIRHKGFIPWDDDVDIMMPRTDYENLLYYLTKHKDELGPYQVFNRNTCKNYIYAITRISDSRYEIIKEDEDMHGMGVFIDIYPYDGLGNSFEKALIKLNKSRLLCDSIVSHRKINSIQNYNLNNILSFLKKSIRNKVYGINYYHKKLNRLKNNDNYDESNYVGPLMWYFTKPEKVLFKRSLFDNLIKVPFEDHSFYVPSDYDKLLKQEYNNYMELPPEECRVGHHNYKTYRKLV